LGARRTTLRPATYVALLYAGFVALVFVPTHLLLQSLYGAQS
jgi:hypothetical protein